MFVYKIANLDQLK